MEGVYFACAALNVGGSLGIGYHANLGDWVAVTLCLFVVGQSMFVLYAEVFQVATFFFTNSNTKLQV